MDILEYIVSEGLVMIPVLYVLGEIIGNTDVLDNKWIPVALLIISLVLTPALLGGFMIDNIIQAVLVAGATVFGNQLYQQSIKEGE